MGEATGSTAVRGMPTVDLVCPLQDEELFLEQLLGSIRGQDYPHILQILLVVAPSTDNTLQICHEAATKDSRIRVVENPERTAPYAMNYGLGLVEADTWARIDGHLEISCTLISTLVRVMMQTGAACVGPMQRTGYSTQTQEAVGLAMSSKYGVGDAKFRLGSYDGPVDAVGYGLYDRKLTDHVGLFNVTMRRNQDDEYNTRLRKAGGVIWLTSEAVVTYYPRATLARLADQYRQYGFWRAVGVIGFDNELRVRQAVPAIFVLGVLVSASLTPRSRKPMGVLASSYGLVLSAHYCSVRGRADSKGTAALSVAAVACMHVSYGAGFLAGAIRARRVARSAATPGA